MLVASAGLLDADVAGADVGCGVADADGDCSVAGSDVDCVAATFAEWLLELHATSAPDNARVSRTATQRCPAVEGWAA